MLTNSWSRPGKRPARLSTLILSLAGLALPLGAVQTRTWSQSEYADFEKGMLKNLSLRSDGLVTLAPAFQEVLDSSSAYLWALARDSKGNLYTGGGTGAKLYRITPQGDKKTLAVLDDLEIHAIAVDAQDRVYAATSPDGKVYRISPDGKSQVFYDPKAKYIWALAFNQAGDLLVATGDPGAVHRVTPEGHGSVFFQSDETHVRSMAVDPAGNLILGTDPGGLVVRVSPSGAGFVLYQLGKQEVSAVAVGPDGAVYAAGIGTKAVAAPAVPPSHLVPAPVSVTNPQQPQLHMPVLPAPSLAPPPSALMAAGSDVYRIDPSGTPAKIWSDAQDIVYAIAFDAQGHVLLGTGNEGYIYRIDSPVLHTTLLNTPCTQITAFTRGPNGALYAATGNVGKIYKIGPGIAPEGSLESDVFDAGFFSQWGRLSFEAHLNGGSIHVVTRSGNLDQPQKSWSPWSEPITATKGSRITSPPARFVQWKATLAAGGAPSPELESVDVAYLQRNVAPRLEALEITPANYRFPAPVLNLPPTQTLTLAPIGKHTATPSVTLEPGATTMQYAKGYAGARWAASDDNGDSLIYTVEIRGVHETEWKLLKDKVKEKYLSWDSTGYPDGEYRIRVTASDLPSNVPSEALSTKMVSEVLLIDNTPPSITSLEASQSGGKLHATWKAADALNDIQKAEYSLDGGEWTLAAPVGGLSDSQELAYDLTLEPVSPGEHTLAVRVEDDYDNQATDKAVVR
jgi:sugar lactone lactonase YvrE